MNHVIESAIVEIFPKTSKPFECFISIYVSNHIFRHNERHA